MKINLHRAVYSLTGKLILTIGALMIIGSAVLGYFLIYYQEKELVKNSIKYGQSFTDLVEKSTRYRMLTFQRSLIQQTVEDIGAVEGVVNIRMFDIRGRIAHSSIKQEIGDIFKKDDPICISCHSAVGGATDVPTWVIKKGEDGYRTLTVVQPIYNESSCYTSACHMHPKRQRILGLVAAEISLSALDKSIKGQKIAIIAFILGFICVVSVVLCIILWNLVVTPIHVIAEGMEKVAAGELDYTVKIDTQDEMGTLASTFNAMTSDLSKAKQELLEWGNTLEKKVREKTDEIKKAQSQLVHSAKLTSLGRMAAGVAHEINSPLTGIITFGHLLRKKFSEGSEEREDIDVIIEQASRCSNIIKGLLGFARSVSAEKSVVSINDIVNSSLNMVRYKADFFNIRIVLNLDSALTVKVDSSQIQQVFLNIILNAADAMDGKGTLTITTHNVSDAGGSFVEVEFNDTGHGISEENMSKLFEPFFTTKPVGKGIGLGLAVSHGIIKEHGGQIFVKSALGEGTSLFVRMPAYENKS